MSDESTSSLLSDNKILEIKKRELLKLEEILADNETYIESLRCQLKVFEHLHQRIIGIRYSELEKIELQILEYQELLEYHSNFKPSDDLKNLYRKIAKKIHPDLANSEDDMIRRHEFMSRANRAYETGNEKELLYILDDWESQAEIIYGYQLEIDIALINQKINRCRKRLDDIRDERLYLETQDIYRLMLRVNSENELGRDILMEMANVLDEKLNTYKLQLELLKKKLRS